MDYCSYYQAIIDKKMTWFFTGNLRSFEHLAFDRTLDVERSLFEFFVPTDMEGCFLAFMHDFEAQGIVTDLQKKPNRLIDSEL